MWWVYNGGKGLPHKARCLTDAMCYILRQVPPAMTKDEAEDLLHNAMRFFEISYDGGILCHYCSEKGWAYFGLNEQEAVHTLMNGRHADRIADIKEGIRLQRKTEYGE